MFGEDIFGIADTRLRGKRIEDLKRNVPHGSYFLASRMPIHVRRPCGVALFIPRRNIRRLINITYDSNEASRFLVAHFINEWGYHSIFGVVYLPPNKDRKRSKMDILCDLTRVMDGEVKSLNRDREKDV